jgi:hypothetical protein
VWIGQCCYNMCLLCCKELNIMSFHYNYEKNLREFFFDVCNNFILFFANLYIMVTKKNLLQIGQRYSLGKNCPSHHIETMNCYWFLGLKRILQNLCFPITLAPSFHGWLPIQLLEKMGNFFFGNNQHL